MKKLTILFLTIILLLQTGCIGDSNDLSGAREPEEIVAEIGLEDKIILDRSEDISDYIVELFGIDDVATIIFNDTALISVIMAYDLDLTQDTKDLIEDIVFDKDEEINKVIITEDKKVFAQTIGIISDLMAGAPYDSHVKQISKMIDKANRKY